MATELTPYDGTMPNSGTLAPSEEIEACRAYRAWHQDTYIPWLIENFPTMAAAANLADMSLYKGEFGEVGTPTSLNIGESVSIGDVFYVSKIDGNTDTPPSVNYATRQTGYSKSEVDTLVDGTHDLMLGVGQSWQDVEASRATEVLYPNNTGAPIDLLVSVTSTANSYVSGYIFIDDGVNPSVDVKFTGTSNTDSTNPFVMRMTVPGGADYKVHSIAAISGAVGIGQWLELR